MNAEKLALEADSFHAVICRSALMLFPNPTTALAEMRRVVKPDCKVSVMVHSTPEKNPYHGLPLEIVRRIGNMPLPPRGQPGMFALSGAGVLEGIYRQLGFRDVAIHLGGIQRRFPSLADALQSIKGSSAALHDLMINLSAAGRERAWLEIEQEMRQFESAKGFEAPGEVLIGVGTK
jgi:ubiquinone/menaquinone biosynthesis C-methylase UbiE